MPRRSNCASDATILAAELKKTHETAAQQGFDVLLNRLAARECDLAAYIIASAFQISETVREFGASTKLTQWVQNEVTARLLVAVEAQHLAQQKLWRDLLPDPEAKPFEPRQKSEENSDGRSK